MKLNKFVASATALLIASTAAYADKAPFQVEGFKRGDQTYLQITALDDLNLWDVKVNRGNCEVGGTYYAGNREILNAIKASKNGIYKNQYNVKYKLENGIIYRNNPLGWDPYINYHMKHGESKTIWLSCSEILDVALSTDDKTWTLDVN